MHRIAVLHMPSCAGGRAALDVTALIAEQRLDVTVHDITVVDQADAIAIGFRGSPTVLVDGRDVEPHPQSPLGTMG